MLRRSVLSAASASAVLSVLPFGARAQAFPNRAMKIVVPFAPGGGNDFLARDIANVLQQRYQQPVVVENRAGGGGVVGSVQVARAPADGYTLLMAANSAAIVDATRDDQPFSLTKDFTAVGLVADMPIMLVVSPETGVHNVRELIALARRRPGFLNVASAGPGTVQHMAAALFDSMAGTKMVHVPFKGASQMVPELLSNRVQVLFGAANSVLPFVRSGKLVPLGVTGDRRWSGMPELPTVAEDGLPGYKVDLWYGLLAPAKTPPEVIAMLNRDLNAYLDENDTRERFKPQALTPAKTTPADFNKRIADDVNLWRGVAKRIGFKAESS
jgi:tripartite-type tricarboxylate transporter receptor subunit TctC